jgi:hypothetical protein
MIIEDFFRLLSRVTAEAVRDQIVTVPRVTFWRPQRFLFAHRFGVGSEIGAFIAINAFRMDGADEIDLMRIQ